jgi:Saxitoxin biosynthesis operon protein SxtJ
MSAMTLQPEKRELRHFGLLMGALLALLFGAVLPWIWDFGYALWPWLIGGVFVLWALVAPRTLAPVYWIWMKIGAALGWVNTRLILGVVFYCLITPIGLVMRLFRHDAMARKFEPRADSYRLKSKTTDRNDMEVPY